MPSDLNDYLAVVEECARERGRTLYVVDDGTGVYWSTIHYEFVPYATRYIAVGKRGDQWWGSR